MHFLQSLFALTLIFVILPWLVLHYTTQWKNGATLTREDEQLLDDLYALTPAGRENGRAGAHRHG